MTDLRDNQHNLAPRADPYYRTCPFCHDNGVRCSVCGFDPDKPGDHREQNAVLARAAAVAFEQVLRGSNPPA